MRIPSLLHPLHPPPSATMMLALALLSAAAAEAAARATIYSLQTTADVNLVIPAVSATAKVLYRNAAGAWEPAVVEASGEVLRLRLEVGKISNGRTLLVLNVPDGVNLDDVRPPTVLRCTVDGKELGTAATVDLGSVETAPQTVSLLVQDELNALVPDSLQVSINGKRLATGAPGVSFKLLDPRQALITIDLSTLANPPATRTTVSISLDDCALDDTLMDWSLSFSCPPVQRLPDGSVLAVDSVTTAAAWQAWQVVTDGLKMDAGGGTTAGRTWLSQENGQPHWISLRFAAPRTVTGVALWWAFYEGYRTSVAYEVQTWDGATWATQVSVKDQREGQCSRHTFPAVTTAGVRIWQPTGSGHPGRAAFMWLSEFEVF